MPIRTTIHRFNQEIMTHVYLPNNLKLEGIVVKIPPQFKYHLDNFKFILGTLFRLKAKDKDKYDHPLISLNSTKLQARVRDYNLYLRYLVDVGILITDNHYKVGEKSKGYWYGEQYAKSEFAFCQLQKRSLTRKNNEEKSRVNLLKRNYSYLTEWLNQLLQIDYEGAVHRLKQLREEDESNYSQEATHYKQLGKVRSTPQERFNLRKYNLDLVAGGIFNPKVDGTVKRFHSTLTSLKSELRHYLTYGGKQLCSVDVRNSQPFISTALFNPDFYAPESEGLNLYKLSPSIYEATKGEIPLILSLLNNLPSIMLVKSDESQCQSDLELYCTLVDKGRLYPFLSEQYAKETGENLDVTIPVEKKKLKEAVFTTLFSDNHFFGQPGAEMKRFFARMFPTVYKIFSLIKKRGKNENLPIILQLMESEVMLRIVAKTLSKTHRVLPLITIHDSIITFKDAGNEVEGAIKRGFEWTLGLKPSLEIQSLSP